jgi:putative membrane protein
MTDESGPSISTHLAQTRTALSFERTRMSTDRTMMSTLRTSFSMIGFGFTLFSFFRTIKGEDILGTAVPMRAPAWFGLSLVVLGILVLGHGLWSEQAFRKRLVERRDALIASGALPADAPMPGSAIRLAGMLLLLIALFAVLGIAARVGPFG